MYLGNTYTMQKDILNLFDNIAIARGLEFFDSVIYLNSFNIILSARYMIFSNKVAELLFFTLNLPQHRNRDIWYSANLCELIEFVNIFNNSQVNTNISSSSININNLYTIYTDVALFFYHSTGISSTVIISSLEV